jgi:sigma-E factor negative regulatory protein RseC
MIKHDGIIIALNEDGTALVRIVQTSACAACKAKAMCASAESAEKEMTVVLLNQEPRTREKSFERKQDKNQDASATTDQSKVTSLGSLLLAPEAYKVGDTVEVMVQQKMGWKAVVLAYLLPFFVMLAVVAVGSGIGNRISEIGEELIGTVALCAMALYYLVLGLFKDKLQKEFSFTARKRA